MVDQSAMLNTVWGVEQTISIQRVPFITRSVASKCSPKHTTARTHVRSMRCLVVFKVYITNHVLSLSFMWLTRVYIVLNWVVLWRHTLYIHHAKITLCFHCKFWEYITPMVPVHLISASWGPIYYHELTFIQEWISNHMTSKVSDEITYPFPNFNGGAFKVWEWISNFISRIIMDVITYPCCE